LKRGADAPLKHPQIIDPEQEELKRDEIYFKSILRRGGHRG